MISSTADAAVKGAQLSNVMQSSGYNGGSSHRLSPRSAGFCLLAAVDHDLRPGNEGVLVGSEGRGARRALLGGGQAADAGPFFFDPLVQADPPHRVGHVLHAGG